MQKARSNCFNPGAVAWFVLSWIAILAAIGTRRIGIALLPALIWAILSRRKSFFLSSGLREQLASLFLVVCAAAITLVWIGSSVTLGGSPSVMSVAGAIKLLSSNIEFRALEFGEISLNAPHSKLPGLFYPLLLVAGIVAMALMVGGMLVRKAVEPIEVYVIAYLSIMLGWPFTDSRFWIPVIPILLAYSVICSAVRLKTGGGGGRFVFSA